MSIEEEEDASLKELVTRTLQGNGVLGKIQAQLRASVFLALEEELRDKSIPLVSPPTRRLLGTREGIVAASLVHDFLQCLGLDFSLSVFVPESGHSSLWSSPGYEALSSSLGLTSSASDGKGRGDGADDKGQKTPLLIELLRERETPPSSAREQNGDTSSSSSISSSNSNSTNSHSRENHHQQQQKEQKEQKEEEEKGKAEVDGSRHLIEHPPRAPSNHIGGKGKGEESQGRGGESQLFPPSLPPINLENGRKREENKNGKVADGLPSEKEKQNLIQPDDSKADSDASLNGEDKQYEDDFSSMSDKDGPDEEEEEEEEEEEVEEDIEEDLDDVSASDLLNSTASGVSDITKDQSLSQASSAPAYQEDL